MLNISVIICCYNSAPRLPQTLKHLAEQQVPQDLNWEVIVVDNNSTDHTAELAKDLWAQYGSPVNLKVVPEREPGLSNARKKGVCEAKGEIIVFCDDDNWLASNYLNIAWQRLRTNNEIGAIGGASIAVTDEGHSLPIWFTSFQKAYAVGVPQLKSGRIERKNSIWGAGMVFKRSIMLNLYKAGFVNLTTDRKGKGLEGGGDDEICFWLILAGLQLYYDDELILWHYMPQSRLKVEYIQELQKAQKLSSDKLRLYKTHISARKFLYSNRNKLNILLYGFYKASFKREGVILLAYAFPLFRHLVRSRNDRRIIDAATSYDHKNYKTLNIEEKE